MYWLRIVGLRLKIENLENPTIMYVVTISHIKVPHIVYKGSVYFHWIGADI